MKTRTNVMLMVALVFALSAFVAAFAQGPAGRRGAAAGARGEARQKWMQTLTQEQRTELQAKMKEMRAAGKTPEEVRAAMTEMLKGWGVEMPQGRAGQRARNGEGNGQQQGLGEGKGRRQGMGRNFMQQLTPDQRTQLEAKVTELKAAGKTPEEIRAAIAEMLKGWGIEAPAARGDGQRGQGLAGMPKLTDEQRTQVQAKMKELREAGKTREEIHAAIAEMLKGWGIEAPAAGAGRQPGQGHS
ncbi:MAG: hypothetical protein ACYC63_20105, partial [Armatimonadota bacterium]